MTTIDFYVNADDRFEVACRLANKAQSQRQRMMIYATDGHSAQRIDRLLWTWQPTAFVPHCRADDPLAAETPVLIASEATADAGCELLLNLDLDCPPHFERFDRLFEIVPRDDTGRAAGRERYRYYRDRGYQIRTHDLAAASRTAGGSTDG